MGRSIQTQTARGAIVLAPEAPVEIADVQIPHVRRNPGDGQMVLRGVQQARNGSVKPGVVDISGDGTDELEYAGIDIYHTLSVEREMEFEPDYGND